MKLFPLFPLLILNLFVGFLQAADRPNFIIILTDDQRQSDLGCYGNEIVQTPNIDKMARDGVLFQNASVTSAICTPSRISYFLGQYERRHGVNFNSGTALSMSAWANSYPVLLRESGYFTGYVGKNHAPIGALGYKTGLMESSFDYWYAGHKQLGFYPKEKHKIFSTAKSNTQTEIIGEAASEFLGSEEPSYLGGAEQFLANRPKDQPFCLSICLNVPHNAGTGSMKMLPEDDELYRSAYRDQIDTLPLPDNYLAKVQVGTKEQPSKLPADLLFTEFRQDSYDWVNTHASARERIIRHYQTITGIDNMVGKIREQLAALEIADNTVIYFTSDHGLLAGEHGLGGKALNYQTCLSVPLIVCDPRVPDYAKGHRKKELVQSIDLAPTILDQAGLGKNPHMQGQSYRNFIRGKSAYWRTYAFSENLWSTYFGNPRIESIRGSRWKYIRYFKNDRTRWKDVKDSKEANAYTASAEDHKLYASWRTATFGEKAEKPVYEELYDLENDPGETTNLIKDSQHSRILTSLREKCQAGAEKARGPLDAQPPVKLN